MARYVMNEHGHFFVVELSIDEAKLSGCELYDTYDDMMDAVCRRHSLSREEVEACEYVVKDTKDGPAIFEDRGFSEPVAEDFETLINEADYTVSHDLIEGTEITEVDESSQRVIVAATLHHTITEQGPRRSLIGYTTCSRPRMRASSMHPNSLKWTSRHGSDPVLVVA